MRSTLFLLLFSSLLFSCAPRNKTVSASGAETPEESTEATHPDAETANENQKDNEAPTALCTDEFTKITSEVGKNVFESNQAHFFDSIKNNLALKACHKLKEKIQPDAQCSVPLIDDESDEEISEDEPQTTVHQTKWRKQNADVFFRLCDDLEEGMKKSFDFDKTNGNLTVLSDVEPLEVVSELKKGDLQFKVLNLVSLNSLLASDLVMSKGRFYAADSKDLPANTLQCKLKSLSLKIDITTSMNFKMTSVQEGDLDDSFSTVISFLSENGKAILIMSCPNLITGESIDIDSLKETFKNTLEFTLKR